MLTKSNLRKNFIVFSFLSRVLAFPAKFDNASGNFHIPIGGRRRLFCRIVLLVFTFHAVIVSGRTLEAGVISRDLPHEFLAFGVMISASYLGICCLGVLIHLTLEIQVQVWNELLRRIDQQGKSSRLGWASEGEKTWQELFIIYFPAIFYPAISVFPVLYYIKPDLPFLLFGNVPQAIKCAPVLVVCCLGDAILSSFHISMANYFVVYVMLFVMQMRKELQSLKQSLDRFGVHPECRSIRSNVPSPVNLVQVQPMKKSDAEARVMPDAEDTLKRQAKIQVICEVKRKVNCSKRGNGTGQLKKNVKDQADLEMIVVVDQSQNIAREFPGNSKLGAQNERKLVDGIGEKCTVKTGRATVAINTMRKMMANAKKIRANKVEDEGTVRRKIGRELIGMEKLGVKEEDIWAGQSEIKRVLNLDDKCVINIANKEIVQVENERAVKPEVKPRGKRSTKTAKTLPVDVEMEKVKFEKIVSDERELNIACRALENIRVLFHLFNLGFANSVFITKVMAVTIIIWSAFASIRIAQTHPLMSFLYGVMAVDVALMYIGMYNDAFHLTGLAERCKSMVLIQSTVLLKNNLISKEKWNEFRCRIAAIPRLAVYSGPFHVLERGSTLIFINFILNKLADLLLAF